MFHLDHVSYVVGGETIESVDRIAEVVGIDADELGYVYKKYGDIYFAIEHINRNKNRRSLTNYEGKYVLDGKRFNKLSDVAKHLGVSESRLHRCYKGCTTWEQVKRKLEASPGRVTYVLEGVPYTSLEKVAVAYGVCKMRLKMEHRKFQDVERALEKVMNFPYNERNLKSHLKNKAYLNSLFDNKKTNCS